MRPAIDDHDYDVKDALDQRFFEEGDKVKITPALPRSRDGAPAARHGSAAAGEGRSGADRQSRIRAAARGPPDGDGAGAEVALLSRCPAHVGGGADDYCFEDAARSRFYSVAAFVILSLSATPALAQRAMPELPAAGGGRNRRRRGYRGWRRTGARRAGAASDTGGPRQLHRSPCLRRSLPVTPSPRRLPSRPLS